MANRGCGCKSPTNTRINENGYAEQSFDGGLTWERIVSDERFSGPIFPPLFGSPSSDIACDGAKSGREWMRIAIDQLVNDTAIWDSVFALITAIIGLLSGIFPGIGTILGAVIAAIAYGLFAFGRAAVQAALTSATLDTFKCILFCNIEDDASFTESGWQQVKQDIVDQFDGIAEFYYWTWANTLGVVGLTNMCRTFPNMAGDCSACSCGECETPTTSGSQAGTNLIARPDLGAGWWQVTTVEVAPGGDDNFYAEIQHGCCELAEYSVVAPGVNAAPGNRVAIGCGGSPTHTGDYGVGQCSELILFRSFGTATFLFRLIDCP